MKIRQDDRAEIARLFSYIKPRTLPYIAGLFGCSIIDAVIPVVTALLTKALTDAALAKRMDLVIQTSVAFGVAMVTVCVLTPFFNYLLGGTVRRIIAGIRQKVFRHLEGLPAEYFENTHSGESISRITNDIWAIENAFSGDIRSLLSLILTGAVSAVVMAILEWRIAGALILFGLLCTYINARFAGPIRRLSDQLQQHLGFSTERLTDLLAGFNVVKMFHLYELIMGRYREVNRKIAEISIARAARFAFLDSANFIMLWINNFGIIIAVCLLMLNGRAGLGLLFTMLLLLAQVNWLFRQLGNFVSQLQSSLAGAARVFDLLDMPPEPNRYPLDEYRGGSGMIEISGGVFGYREGEKVLDGLALKVEKGGIAALVGPSGGGKSTVIKLLLGFYPLQAGGIYINGRPLGEYPLARLREMTAYVPQDAYLFAGTIEENIRYGRLDATHDEVISAAKAANAHDYIMEQPEGYNTIVGERGVKLSGGQKQRIAIARALLKDAPILLLDEATSALDSESEQLVQDALNTLMRGRTTIVVAHRLSTIQHADVIYVIAGGKVVEQGKHEELLSAGELYSRLYRMQFRQDDYAVSG